MISDFKKDTNKQMSSLGSGEESQQHRVKNEQTGTGFFVLFLLFLLAFLLVWVLEIGSFHVAQVGPKPSMLLPWPLGTGSQARMYHHAQQGEGFNHQNMRLTS